MNGLDATAARTFGTLCAALQTKGVQLIITHVPKGQMRRLLAAHGVTAPPEESPQTPLPHHTCLAFPTMDAGMQVAAQLASCGAGGAWRSICLLLSQPVSMLHTMLVIASHNGLLRQRHCQEYAQTPIMHGHMLTDRYRGSGQRLLRGLRSLPSATASRILPCLAVL